MQKLNDGEQNHGYGKRTYIKMIKPKIYSKDMTCKSKMKCNPTHGFIHLFCPSTNYNNLDDLLLLMRLNIKRTICLCFNQKKKKKNKGRVLFLVNIQSKKNS